MARLLVVAVLFIALFGWASSPLTPGGKRRLKRLAVGALLAACFIAALRAGLVWVGVIGLGTLLALRWALPGLTRLLLAVRSRRGSFEQQGAPATPVAQGMTRAQAFEVLNLREGASREEILSSYRELIRKVHPDRGGSSYLAMQVNRARDTLLK